MSRSLVAPAFCNTLLRRILLASAIVVLPLHASATAIPHLSRSFVQFGFVPHDVASQVQAVFVTNTGDAALTIAALNVSGAQAAAFKVGGTCTPPIVLPPAARCRVDVTATAPLAVLRGAPFNGTLTVQTDAGATDVTLRGAVDPGFDVLTFFATPSYLDIGAQAVGTTAAPQPWVLANRGTESFLISQLALVGGDFADFALTSDCAAGQTLSPGKACSMSVAFTPQAGGPRATELSFQATLHGTTGTYRYSVTGIGGAAAPVDVVEYYNATLDHYFITWVAAEQANLDAGNTPTRWTRTGFAFHAYVAAQSGTSPVCRYYLPPVFGDSHFFGRGTAECDATGAAHPAFVLEDPQFMHVYLPAAGTCPAGTTPIYRVFSNRPDANHRYMTDRSVREQMVARGWLAEGDGPDLVVMCSA